MISVIGFQRDMTGKRIILSGSEDEHLTELLGRKTYSKDVRQKKPARLRCSLNAKNFRTKQSS